MGSFLLITGPIASGKSTVAAALTDRMAADGRSAAAVDLDDALLSLRAPLERFDESWEIVRRIHGQLVAAWLSSGIDAVIAHGPIITGEDERLLLHAVEGVTPRRALLRVPFAVAAQRVTDDPSRSVSKDLAFLRSSHEQFAASIPVPSPFDWDFDTSVTTIPEIVEHIAPTLL